MTVVTPAIPSGTSDQRASSGGGSFVVTPPSPLHQGAGSCTGLLASRYTFSVETCHELLTSNLLTAAQLRRERERAEFMGFTTDNSETDLSFVLSAVESNLECPDLNSRIVSIQREILKLNVNIAYLSEVSELTNKKITVVEERSREATPPAGVLGVHDSSYSAILEAEELLNSLTVTEQETYSEVKSPKPSPDEVITFIPTNLVDFRDLTVEGILRDINITEQQSQGRFTAYFGKVAYRYGHVSHSPSNYPKCETMDIIQSRMRAVEPDFALSEYMCMITHYPDGKSGIPLHSDSQQCVEGSQIWTISVGAERTLTLLNQVGRVNERKITLPHGSLHKMSTDSQKHWRHGIEIDSLVNEPRISFTFRKLVESEPPSRPRAPPIRKPCNGSQSHKRILFLTDSILSGISDRDFHTLKDYRCVKKVAPQLTKICDYEDDFNVSDIVVISSGINDLSCYNFTAESLADHVRPILKRYCKSARNTTFVFNSLLHTRHRWLNKEVDIFNKLMLELSCQIENLKFFDSHDVLKGSSLARNVDNVLPLRDTRGVHISSRAVNLVRNELLKAIELLDSRWKTLPRSSHLRGWTWPLAVSRVRDLQELRSWFGYDFVHHHEYVRSPVYA